MTTAIRDLITNTLYPTKAYNLPSLCERLGLAPGTEEEAFASKTKYIIKRLNAVSDAGVVAIGREVLKEFPNDYLRAAIERIDDEGGLVSDITRHNVAEALDPFVLAGKRDLMEMIRKFWPHIDHTSTGFETTLADDIERHMLSFAGDWANSYMLERVGFLTCSQTKFFEFVEDVVNPVRRDQNEQAKIVAALNPILLRDGYRLSEHRKVSGYPLYKVIRSATANAPSDNVVAETLIYLNADSVNDAWKKALDRRSVDPEGAITAAKTLLETVCKHIIEELGEVYGPSDDLPKLSHSASKLLNLAPSQHSEDVFRSILGNCHSIVSNLAGLRNKLGDSHGQGRKHVRPSARHAELAVNLAGTMAMFLVSTMDARRKSD